MEFKGTKGKWEVVINDKTNKTRIEVRAYPYTNRTEFYHLMHEYMLDEEQCSVKGCGCVIEEISNAKLIAAAPEMFEMIKKLIITFKCDELENYQEVRIKEAEQLLTKITQ